MRKEIDQQYRLRGRADCAEGTADREPWKAADPAGVAQFAREVRYRLGMTQVELACSIDVSLQTLRNWEQGKRGPSGAARSLLRVLNAEPEWVLKVLHRDRRQRAPRRRSQGRVVIYRPPRASP